jgi:hypothetical protein
VIERSPLGPTIDVVLLDHEATVLAHQFAPASVRDQTIGFTLRTQLGVFGLFLLVFRLSAALLLPLADWPTHEFVNKRER